MSGLQGGFDGTEGSVLLGQLTAALEGEAEAQDEDAPHGPANNVPDEGRHHGGVEAGVRTAAKDRSRMLGAPPADRHIDDRHIHGGEDGENGGERLALAGGGEAPQHQVADVEQPEQQHAGKARVPRPPDAPGSASPDAAGDQADSGVDHGDFGGGEGESVRGEGLEGIAAAPIEIGERGHEVNVGEEQAQHRAGNVVVEDPSSVALGCVGRDEKDRFAEADEEDDEGGEEPEPGDSAEDGGSGHYAGNFTAKALFGVEHGFKEQNADDGEDEIVSGELGDPGIDFEGIELGGENSGGGFDHSEKCRQ